MLGMRIEIAGLRAKLFCSRCPEQLKYPPDVRPETTKAGFAGLAEQILAQHCAGPSSERDKLHLPRCKDAHDWPERVGYVVLRDGRDVHSGEWLNPYPRS